MPDQGVCPGLATNARRHEGVALALRPPSSSRMPAPPDRASARWQAPPHLGPWAEEHEADENTRCGLRLDQSAVSSVLRARSAPADTSRLRAFAPSRLRGQLRSRLRG